MADITVHHVHTIEPSGATSEWLAILTGALARIERKVTDLMAYTEDELIGQIADARAAIGRIETDIQGLLDRERHLTVESREAMEALLGDLHAVDARVPDPAVEPPVEPPVEAIAPEWGSAEAPVVGSDFATAGVVAEPEPVPDAPPVEPTPEAPPAEPVVEGEIPPAA